MISIHPVPFYIDCWMFHVMIQVWSRTETDNDHNYLLVSSAIYVDDLKKLMSLLMEFLGCWLTVCKFECMKIFWSIDISYLLICLLMQPLAAHAISVQFGWFSRCVRDEFLNSEHDTHSFLHAFPSFANRNANSLLDIVNNQVLKFYHQFSCIFQVFVWFL